MDRFVQFAVAASRMALEDAGWTCPRRIPTGSASTSGPGSADWPPGRSSTKFCLKRGPKRVSPFFIPMMIANMAAGQVSIATGAKGPSSAAISACATGTHSIGDAFKIIQRGDADVMIAGGAEATIRPLAFAGFCAAQALVQAK